MNGEDLYNLYAEAMADRGMGLDPWESLAEGEQAAWDAVGEEVVERGRGGLRGAAGPIR